MSVRKEEIELLRQQEEKVLTSEPRKIWQSIGENSHEMSELAAVRGQEFAKLPMEALNAPATGSESLSRRRFLQFSAAASALVATTACKRRPVDHLVPYVNKPQGLTYGVPFWYASSGPSGLGVLVKTREGRPIKLEGNPDHPVNAGGLDAQTQASIFDLYNPDRLRGPVVGKTQKASDWNAVTAAVTAAIASAGAGGVRVLTGALPHPTTKSSLDSFNQKFNGKHHVAPSVSTDPFVEAVFELGGVRSMPTLKFGAADVVVSFDADFLGTWIRPVEFTKAFTSRRKMHQGGTGQNKLYCFESIHSLTGIAADFRQAIKPSQQLGILMALGAEVSKLTNSDAGAAAVFSRYSADKLSVELGFSVELVKKAARDLANAKGKSLVVAGGSGPHSFEVQMAALALNGLLGNIGSTLDFERPMVLGTELGSSFSELVKDMNAGAVKVLVIQGTNPVYSNPNSGFEAAASKVGLIVQLSPEINETSKIANFVLPESHFLEAWGDSEIRAGVYSIQQPVIEPLYLSKSLGELLDEWTTGTPRNYRDVVSAYWQKNIHRGGDFKNWWMEQLKAGAMTTAANRRSPGFKWGAVASAIERAKIERSTGPEVALYASVALGDGALANNPYLQELPDPVTKVTWGNFAGVSSGTAKSLGLNLNHYKDADLKDPKALASDFSSDVLEVTVNGKSLELPVFVQTGLADGVVAVALGYGRSAAGQIGTGVGVDASGWISGEDGRLKLRGAQASLRKTGKKYELACTQKHFNLQGRDVDILHQYTSSEFAHVGSGEAAHGSSANDKFKKPHVFSIYDEKEFVYPGSKWGMAVDLNSCTGCNACVVGCYIENNVSTVGRDEVIMGRHSAWLRLDLYHTGTSENPESCFEPMMCQHCDKAPCETVCPVLATVHSSDGLNDMSYNRCVGTRYCANNCPYKVRRFNWFQYSDKLAMKVEKQDPLPMLINPDVSVRTRGVMEKCTFCVQRIRTEQKDRMTKIADGQVKTACQQSCPADAIVFGDLNDPQSRVSKLAHQKGGFKVLEVLNVRPNVTYLPRIRNKDSAV